MKISVCIPSANPDLLKLCLSSLKIQTKKPFEILVSRKTKPLAIKLPFLEYKLILKGLVYYFRK